MALTYSQKELKFNLFAAVIEGIRAANVVGKGSYITYSSHDDDNYSIELWTSATKPELGDAELKHKYLVNKWSSEMNDTRLWVVVKHVCDHCEKFIDGIRTISKH